MQITEISHSATPSLLLKPTSANKHLAHQNSEMLLNSAFEAEKKTAEELIGAEEKNSGKADQIFLSDIAQEKSQQKDASAATVSNQTTSVSGEELSEAEVQEVAELKRRDAEVRSHEQAHLSAAGNLAQGAANFSYANGPDGNRYAVGGEVNIDTSGVAGDAQATLLKAQKIRRAASAPAEPSSQDRSVAAEASRMEAQARVEISQQARAKQAESKTENTPDIDFLSAQKEQSEQAIQDTYKKIQNSSVLQEQRNFIDFFI